MCIVLFCRFPVKLIVRWERAVNNIDWARTTGYYSMQATHELRMEVQAMRKHLILLISAFVLLTVIGCKDRDSDEYGFLGEFIGPSQDQTPSGLDPVYNLTADTNRSGTVDTGGTDDYGEDTWSAAHGAVMLYNNDDDDGGSERDHVNSTVDGAQDALDLATLVVKQIADIQPGSYGQISVDADTGSYVQVFRYDGGVWSLFDPLSATISAADLAAGNVTFGIESRHYAETATGAAGLWSGTATLTLSVKDSGDVTLGTDTLQIRTAPFMLATNNCYAQRMYVCNVDSSFVSDLTAICSGIGLPITVINNVDRWTQDQFELGFIDVPTGGNPVVLNSPRGRELHDYAWDYLLGPDFGCLEYGSETMNSLNSFGNLECLPPYGSFPLGRVIVGGGGSRHMEQAITDFLSAQSIQGPVYELDTSWLAVGHVDEIMSCIPAANARGWVVAWASPDVALDILQNLHDTGYGSLPVFEGKVGLFPETSVDVILNNSSLVSFNDAVQAMLDSLKTQLKTDLGLSDADFVEIPVLFYSESGYACAYTAGAVNWIVVRPHVIVADQFGPEVSGIDQFEADITAKLAALGLTAHYLDDWYSYHCAMGEVHCGTNVLRTPPAAPRWWNTGK